MELGIPLGLAQRRQIIRQRLAQLSGREFLSQTDVAWLSCRLTARHYAAGEVVLREGTHGDCLGLVTRGQLAVFSSLSSRGSPILLLLPGSTFGEAMLTGGRPSDRTLSAVTDAEVLFLRRADFLDVVEQRQSQSAGGVSRWLRRLAVMVLLVVVIGTLLALKPTRQAVALVPYSAGLWLEQRGHTDWAGTTWALAQRLVPEWNAPHLSLGNLYLRRGQLGQAEAELELAQALTPDLAEAHNSLGLLYAARGDRTAAVEAFRQALALEPGQATVEGNLALNLQLVGQREAALRHYALARSLDAPRPVPLTNEAIAHFEAGSLAAAESAVRWALDLDGTSAPANTVLGAVYLARQQPWAAKLALEQAIHLDPAYGPAHLYLGLAYRALNEPSLAYAAFDYVVSLNYDPLARRQAHWYLSELYTQYGTDLDRNQSYPPGERK